METNTLYILSQGVAPIPTPYLPTSTIDKDSGYLTLYHTGTHYEETATPESIRAINASTRLGSNDSNVGVDTNAGNITIFLSLTPKFPVRITNNGTSGNTVTIISEYGVQGTSVLVDGSSRELALTVAGYV